MLDILREYVKNNEYYIIISENSLYINNYKKIYEISNNTVLIEVDKLYKIKGKNFKLVKKENNELEIKGIIESIIKS